MSKSKGLWISFFCIVAGWLSIGIGYGVRIDPALNGILFFGGVIMFVAGVIGIIVFAQK